MHLLQNVLSRIARLSMPRQLSGIGPLKPRFFTPCQHCLCPSQQWLCEHCLEDLPHVTQCCARCGVPSPASPCALCTKHLPPFSTTLCAYWYVPPINSLIRTLKQKHPVALLNLLVPALIDRLHIHYADHTWPEVLIPTPSHWHKQLRRGFHPSLALAEQLSSQLKPIIERPVVPAIVQRQSTPEQKSLGRQQRLKNLHNAFHLPDKYRPHVQAKTIAIVDDVITTGATATALTQCLLAAGANRVDLWALARTP